MNCRYYTERTLGWMLNNKIIVLLSMLSFCLFVSTLAMAGQRNRLREELETATRVTETEPTPTTDVTTDINTESTTVPETEATTVIETEPTTEEATTESSNNNENGGLVNEQDSVNSSKEGNSEFVEAVPADSVANDLGTSRLIKLMGYNA